MGKQTLTNVDPLFTQMHLFKFIKKFGYCVKQYFFEHQFVEDYDVDET